MKDAKTNKSKKQNDSQNEMTVNEFLNAISGNEYPDYLIETIRIIRNWLLDSTQDDGETEEIDDPFAAIFGHNFYDEPGSLHTLFSRLSGIEEFVDIIPYFKEPDGKPDTIIINMVPSDYENGLRTAIDYSAVFHRGKIQRVWIISNSYALDEIVKFSSHIDALNEQGIALRYILVTPWGWVEMPLSGETVTKRQFLWHSAAEEDESKNLKKQTKNRQQGRNNSSKRYD